MQRLHLTKLLVTGDILYHPRRSNSILPANVINSMSCLLMTDFYG